MPLLTYRVRCRQRHQYRRTNLANSGRTQVLPLSSWPDLIKGISKVAPIRALRKAACSKAAHPIGCKVHVWVKYLVKEVGLIEHFRADMEYHRFALPFGCKDNSDILSWRMAKSHRP